MGSMIVSTPVLARYKIGDLIRACEPPYFRCIGRDKWWTPLRYAWDEFRSLIWVGCEQRTLQVAAREYLLTEQ